LTLFLRHPRTPISTLSPYTTLFRSNNLGEARTEHKALCLPSWVQLYRRRASHLGPHRTVIDSLSLAFRPVHSGNRREGIRPNGQKVASPDPGTRRGGSAVRGAGFLGPRAVAGFGAPVGDARAHHPGDAGIDVLGGVGGRRPPRLGHQPRRGGVVLTLVVDGRGREGRRVVA